jgi:hypothetical protein
MKSYEDLRLHPEHPVKAWVVVEQPRGEPYRMKYDAASGEFVRTGQLTLGHVRGDGQSVYGWIGGTGIPPQPHFDVLLLTDQDPGLGDILAGVVCGMFQRADGDHKFVAVDEERAARMAQVDFFALREEEQAGLRALYPRVGANEGWFGAQTAREYLREKKAEDR